LAGSRYKRLATRGISASASASASPAISTMGSSVPSENANGSVPSDEAQAPAPNSNPDVVQIVPDDEEEEEERVHLTGKRFKSRTSEVWKYFTPKVEVVEVNGKKYEQMWGYCNFPKCNTRYRAEGTSGTTGFKNHLRTKHSTLVGQQQLKVGKDPGTELTHVKPFKYDQEISLKKLNLAITMHEYPFNIVEHEYLVDSIKSLRPSFPLKSRVTIRKEIMEKNFGRKGNIVQILENYAMPL
jgi:hypothetical protein